MAEAFDKLEEKYREGINLLKGMGYYQPLVSEIECLVKYLDDQLFIHLLSFNLFSDIQGVFSTFVRTDLSKIYAEMLKYPDIPEKQIYKQKFTNLEILHKCVTNITYQVKSLVRLPQMRNLTFKSRYLKAMSRKLSGEIQMEYKEFADNYKKYFRKRFSGRKSQNELVSLNCLRELVDDYNTHFGKSLKDFQDLSQALNYMREFFILTLENRIRNNILPIFNDQDKFPRIIDYFINDLKRTFIQILFHQYKNEKSFVWIKKASLEFIQSERFGILLKKVIIQTLSIMLKNPRMAYSTLTSD
ncbi:MAG: hypothetical protein GQ561_04100 [Calditrichae bacterium]|nr:hypothetical protein [Calditrichia bacterium]